MSSREEMLNKHLNKKKAEIEYQLRKEEEWSGIKLSTYILCILFFPLFALPITWVLLPRATVQYWNMVVIVFCTNEYIESHVKDVLMFAEIFAKMVNEQGENKKDE